MVWFDQAAKRPRTASEARESVNLLDNVIGLSPFFDNPSIAEDRGEDNENDFSEKRNSLHEVGTHYPIIRKKYFTILLCGIVEFYL